MKQTNKDQIVTIKGQQYSFHSSVTTEQINNFKTTIENGLTSQFNQVYGRITTEKEKHFRKLLNAVIRARNNPVNKGKKVITVRLSDRSIKLRPLYL